MLQNLSAQIVCPSRKVWNFDGKRLHWASVVRDLRYFEAGGAAKKRAKISHCVLLRH